MTPPRIHVVHPGCHFQCSTYLITGPRAAVLVDPGFGREQPAVLAGIARAGWTLEKLTAIVLTHCHVDHVLGVPQLRRCGPPVWASSATARLLRRADPQVWCEYPDRVPVIDVDAELSDGHCLDLEGLRIECVATPGHTAGCMSFVVESSDQVLAATGDLLMPDPRFPGWAGGPDFSVAQTLASLQKLMRRGVTSAYTGHGTVASASEWLERGVCYGSRNEWVLEYPPKMCL